MKTLYKNILPILTGALIISSCATKLEIEPEDNISSEVALENAADVNNALVGAYTVIARGALYGNNLVMVPDLYASKNYLLWTGSFSTYRQIFSQTIRAENEDVTRTWTNAYEAINIANTVISSLDVVEDPDQKNLIEGKALFIRGIMFFELVRLYGLPYEAGSANSSLAVPIPLTAVKKFEDINSDEPQKTVAEVYTQAENDLLKSIELLADSPDDLYAAQGMLARLYLQQAKYDKARDLANAVISSDEFSLMNDLEAPFREKNSNEGVFEIQQNEQSNAGSSNDGLSTFYSYYENSTGGEVGRGDLLVTETYYNSLAETDKRKTNLIYQGIDDFWHTKKWYNYFDNIPVVRLTELVLMRAECNFRLGTSVGETALNDINRLMTRANVATYTSLTLDIILKQRDIELAFEGYRLHDLKRTKRNIGDLPYNSIKAVFPIPARELEVNKLLKQHDGY